MPALPRDKAQLLVRLRSPEWIENQKRWRFLADSYEGGNRYRNADYAGDPTRVDPGQTGQGNLTGYGGNSHFGIIDPTTSQSSPMAYGQIVDRNLVPYLSETGNDGKATYLVRLARTPVPKTLERVIRRHLSRIYSREVRREGPQALIDWWEDVDGRETAIDKWMRKVVAPLLCVYGNLDLIFDHPKTDGDPGQIQTMADASAAGVDGCVANYILPDNMIWWKLDRSGRRYVECLVIERNDWHQPFYRHWTPVDSVLYAGLDAYGKGEGEVVEVVEHPYGRPPIVRLFDERKFRSRNTGQPRYESVAELQKAIYNGWSELILGDIFAAHPILQGPEKYLQGDDKVATGPDQIFPTFVSSDGTVVPWSYVAAPQGQAESQLAHIREFTDMSDRDAALTKPAGMTSGTTVSQSGVSKSFDSQEGNDYLSEISETLGDAERVISEYVLLVLGNGKVKPADLEAIKIQYPKEFDLFTAEDLSAAIADIQGLAAAAGSLPQVEGELFDRLLRTLLPGLDDATMGRLRTEVDGMLASKAESREMRSESGLVTMTDQITNHAVEDKQVLNQYNDIAGESTTS